MGTKTRTLTDGPIAQEVALFSLPLLGASLIQLCYSTVDALFAGNVLGVQGIAAIGASSFVAVCLVSFFSGFSVGANVVAATAFGSGNRRGVGEAVGASLLMAIAAGSLLGIGGFALSPQFIELMGVPTETAADACTYLSIYFLSLPFVTLFNLSAAILRGLGDSSTPFKLQLVGGGLNIALNALLLLVFHLGIAGIAWTTVIGQGVASLLSIWCVVRTMRALAPDAGAASIRLSARCAAAIVRIGLPSGIQSMAVTLSNTIVQSVINGFSAADIAAFTAYFKIEMLVYQPIVALGQAATVFTAQNVGSRKHDRVHKGVRWCLALGIASALVTAGALLAVGPYSFLLFVHDADVAARGCAIIATTFPFYWLYAFVEVYAGACRGAERSGVPAAVILVGFAGARPALLFLTPLATQGVQGVAAIYPITWAVVAAALFCYYTFVVHRHMHDALPDGGHPEREAHPVDVATPTRSDA